MIDKNSKICSLGSCFADRIMGLLTRCLRKKATTLNLPRKIYSQLKATTSGIVAAANIKFVAGFTQSDSLSEPTPGVVRPLIQATQNVCPRREA